MSQTSNIYGAVNTLMTTLFSDKKQLSDSLNIENNDDLFLADGYAIYFGPAVNTRRMVGCKFSVSRSISITLTKAIRGTHKDLTKIKAGEKSLLENQFTLIKDFSQNQIISDVSSKRNFVSDNGIERVFGDDKHYLMIETIFDIEYFENLA